MLADVGEVASSLGAGVIGKLTGFDEDLHLDSVFSYELCILTEDLDDRKSG